MLDKLSRHWKILLSQTQSHIGSLFGRSQVYYLIPSICTFCSRTCGIISDIKANLLLSGCGSGKAIVSGSNLNASHSYIAYIILIGNCFELGLGHIEIWILAWWWHQELNWGRACHRAKPTAIVYWRGLGYITYSHEPISLLQLTLLGEDPWWWH